ncbi:unnamed protein product [Rhizoctonia solani]|uniref:F-box domain-containing protein n=1 Tax=Rhizoctonia solani TaxID=456999 RepID=A0A8H2WC34_9AGAM|nr:unnamed protein product [Rhizoctonia solani]
MLDINEPLPTLLHQWKETGSALATTLSKYLDLCTLLSNASELTNTTGKDLVFDFDSVLQPEGLLSVLSGKLTSAQEILAKARNRVASPIYKFPAEILSNIFPYFIHAQDSNSPVYIELSIRRLYSRLHTLLAVCSVWRGIGLSMPMLWNLIPVIRNSRFLLSYAGTNLSLNRSGGLPLSLGIVVPHVIPGALVTELTQHASRIRTINIAAHVPCAIQQVMIPLMAHGLSDSLSELALSAEDVEHVDRLRDNPWYMISPDDERDLLPLIQPLTRLKLAGATLDWGPITFSPRLVELRLQAIIIGHDSFLYEFLGAISTAPELQTLELMSVISFPDPDLEDPPKVVLTKLRSLVLDDLHFNTLSIILRSITPNSYQLTLAPTRNILTTVISIRDFVTQPVDIFDLCDLIEGRTIQTLLFMNQDRCLHHDILTLIMNTMSTINTLKLDNWTVDEGFCRAFTRREHQILGLAVHIPNIRHLSLSNVRIDDQGGLKELVHSHNLETIFLSGDLNHGPKGSENPDDWRPLGPWDEEVVERVAGQVPGIGMALGDYRPTEFLSAIWQL